MCSTDRYNINLRSIPNVLCYYCTWQSAVCQHHLRKHVGSKMLVWLYVQSYTKECIIFSPSVLSCTNSIYAADAFKKNENTLFFYQNHATCKVQKQPENATKKSLSCAHLYFADLLITDCCVMVCCAASKECKTDKKSLELSLFN